MGRWQVMANGQVAGLARVCVFIFDSKGNLCLIRKGRQQGRQDGKVKTCLMVIGSLLVC